MPLHPAGKARTRGNIKKNATAKDIPGAARCNISSSLSTATLIDLWADRNRHDGLRIIGMITSPMAHIHDRRVRRADRLLSLSPCSMRCRWCRVAGDDDRRHADHQPHNWVIEKVAYCLGAAPFWLAPLITSPYRLRCSCRSRRARANVDPAMVSQTYQIGAITVSEAADHVLIIAALPAILVSLNRTRSVRARKPAAACGAFASCRPHHLDHLHHGRSARRRRHDVHDVHGVVVFSDGFRRASKPSPLRFGGIGSIPSVIGGLLIGVLESMWPAYFSLDYKDVAAFWILAIVLIFLPSGILGRPEVEKV